MDRKLSVYESIIQSIKRDIELGIIAEGEKLPSCRDMAMQLGINPNTVQRAYSELEAQGVIYTIPKKGVYAGNGSLLPDIFSGGSPHPGTEPDQSNYTSNLKDMIVKLKDAGFSRGEIIQIIDEVYKND